MKTKYSVASVKSNYSSANSYQKGGASTIKANTTRGLSKDVTVDVKPRAAAYMVRKP